MFYLYENGQPETIDARLLSINEDSNDFHEDLLKKGFLEVLNYEQTLFEITVLKHSLGHFWVVLIYDLSGFLDAYRVDTSFGLAALLNLYSVKFELASDGE
ncbi:MAG: hypothetical protein ACERJ1_18020 [Halodesulfovibrio sp.]|uniref:hypothetical protein n=1 Tax=Halodesulfovibrio sp. TaxID=1912772 RepID=UPI00359EEA11